MTALKETVWREKHDVSTTSASLMKFTVRLTELKAFAKKAITPGIICAFVFVCLVYFYDYSPRRAILNILGALTFGVAVNCVFYVSFWVWDKLQARKRG